MITLLQIRDKLTMAIKDSGLSQTEIAKHVGISQSAIAHYLKGDIFPALDTFANLCAVLDVDANDILCLDEYQ